MSYCIYLRKSRKDLEAEQHGEGETLARHERALLSLAKKNNLIISNIYREVVSGETIAARPVMQQLLREVEQNLWDGVLVMEVERLARGDTIDQGVVQRAFQYSNTLIITPSKTYDPANEFDEEYFEFGLFMSRREYKTIKRRMQNGRYAAISEGKWPYNSAPYGFRRTKLEKEKGWTLAFDENEAPVVRLIFSMFTGPERVGIRSITRTLNSYGTKPRNSKLWSESTVRGILSNVVYDQCVKIGERKVVRTVENGVLTTTRPRTSDYTIVSGRHPRLIDHDVFAEAQSYLGCGSPKPAGSNIIKNPLAGIIVCSECKKKMIRRPPSGTASRVPYDLMLCSTYDCPTIGSPLDLVEREVYNALSDWVEGYRLSGQTPSISTPRAYPPPGLPTDKNQHTRGTVSATHWRSRAEDTLFFRLMQSSPERRQKTMRKKSPLRLLRIRQSSLPFQAILFPWHGFFLILQLHPSVYPAHFL